MTESLKLSSRVNWDEVVVGRGWGQRTEALACAVAVAHLMSPDMTIIRIMEETGPCSWHW